MSKQSLVAARECLRILFLETGECWIREGVRERVKGEREQKAEKKEEGRRQKERQRQRQTERQRQTDRERERGERERTRDLTIYVY